MIDLFEVDFFFCFLKNFIYMLVIGYYFVGYVEVGNIYIFVFYNQVEYFRIGFVVCISNKFFCWFEFGGWFFYGFGDQWFKYGGIVCYNIMLKKCGMWIIYYNYDIEQIGVLFMVVFVGFFVSIIICMGLLDKFIFVDKVGINFEKDIGKDFIFFGGLEWKQYIVFGKVNYEWYDEFGGLQKIFKI